MKNDEVIGSVGALDQECALADAFAEVVQLGAADFATVGHLDFRDPWRVKWENPLDTLAV